MISFAGVTAKYLIYRPPLLKIFKELKECISAVFHKHQQHRIAISVEQTLLQITCFLSYEKYTYQILFVTDAKKGFYFYLTRNPILYFFKLHLVVK